MCTSLAEGGLRCSSHAREALSKAVSQYTEKRETASAEERQELLDNITRKRFEYATTPEGKAEAERMIAEQQARADQERERLGGDKAPFHAVFDGDEHRLLRGMQETQRRADALRKEQEVARDRHREVTSGNVGDQTAKALDEEKSKSPENVAVEDYNGNWHRSTIIGVVAVDEPFTTTDNSYEVAAWSMTHEVQPGVYPVHLTDQGDLSWGYDTKVTDQNMPPLLGGVAQGAGPKNEIGKTDRLSRRSYAFSASSAYTPGLKFGGGSLVLREGVTVDRDLHIREGRVSSVLTRFKIENAVDTEPKYNKSRRSRLA